MFCIKRSQGRVRQKPVINDKHGLSSAHSTEILGERLVTSYPETFTSPPSSLTFDFYVTFLLIKPEHCEAN